MKKNTITIFAISLLLFSFFSINTFAQVEKHDKATTEAKAKVDRAITRFNTRKASFDNELKILSVNFIKIDADKFCDIYLNSYTIASTSFRDYNDKKKLTCTVETVKDNILSTCEPHKIIDIMTSKIFQNSKDNIVYKAVVEVERREYTMYFVAQGDIFLNPIVI